jgi:aerobic-type carbon monoxide dehydrogenase small subunit (CoxS/CutS family)
VTDKTGPVPEPVEDRADGKERQAVTRRDFLVGASTGVAATAAVALGTPVQHTATPPAQPSSVQGHVAPPAPASLPASMRRVKLSINGVEHEVVVEVRESLWQTMTYQLGMGGSNIGCDRAQCGACTVVIDGRAVNACAVLTARLGRGQKILTVDALATGPGVAGLHPVQRAFWQEGGFQCGICTRGFIMSTYALLQANKNPTRDQIRDALGGNICRCGEYAKIYDSVEKAAAEMRSA